MKIRFQPMLMLSLMLSASLAIAEGTCPVVQDLTATPYSAWDDGCYCQDVIYGPPNGGYRF
jgi:hypothetical protein